MSAPAPIETLLETARSWYEGLPSMTRFAPWPNDLVYSDLPPRTQPGVAEFTAHPGRTTAHGMVLRDAALAAAPYLHWRTGYTEAQVGADFLNRFCWCELAAPEGLYRTETARVTLAYWGAGLWYDWHWHAAEELYSVVSGAAEFFADGLPDATLAPGDTRLHASNQPHAMRTHDTPVLTLINWRGGDMSQMPEIGR